VKIYLDINEEISTYFLEYLNIFPNGSGSCCSW